MTLPLKREIDSLLQLTQVQLRAPVSIPRLIHVIRHNIQWSSDSHQRNNVMLQSKLRAMQTQKQGAQAGLLKRATIMAQVLGRKWIQMYSLPGAAKIHDGSSPMDGKQ